MINKVVLVGRLTKEIELRKTNGNVSVCSFTLACNRRYQSQTPGAQTADFINCIAWRQSADYLAQYSTKGSIVGVEGRIQTRSYDGQNGKVYVTEVVCDSVSLIGSTRQNGDTRPQTNNQTFTPSNEASFSSNNFEDDFSNTPSLDISSDDLPFY